MIDNMPEKTGKSLDQWKQILSKKNFAKHGEAVKFLKSEHQVTHGFANTIVTLYRKDSEEVVDLVATQYKGKEALLPIHEALVKYAKTLGSDVKITPKKTSVSVIRKNQFILIKPATKTRLDLGLKIKGQEPKGLLEGSGPFGSMCTHRIKLESPKDVNKEVKAWIKMAYEASV